ncbi:GRAM domain-containing protein 2B-like [Gouania willdenowi]|uniref:GRAM domain-containing protein 2B-like n=1 Tax=Gouania willdenowi TaxID=441366 RepID=A0A8C5I3I7_GOUWI|nr:GRAM domain-containing protein 2B-like [Gouania willdenowi]
MFLLPNMSFKGSRKFSLDSSVLLEGLGNRSGMVASRRPRLSPTLDDARLTMQELNSSFDSNVSLREQPITEESFQRSDGPIRSQSFQKHNKNFHKLFYELPEDENLTYTFSCALQKEVLYNGRLFLSENHVCFYSSVLLKDTKVVIPLSSVREVKRLSSALSVLSIQTTDGEKHTFVSLRGRDLCYKLLQRVCSSAQDWSTNSSPQISSAENDVDQMSSYSSLDECPCYESSGGFPGSEVSTTRNSMYQEGFTNEEEKNVSQFWMFVERILSFLFIREVKNLSVLFSIYLILLLGLLLVSGYIGLRLMALEEQLNSLGTQDDFTPHRV